MSVTIKKSFLLNECRSDALQACLHDRWSLNSMFLHSVDRRGLRATESTQEFPTFQWTHLFSGLSAERLENSSSSQKLHVIAARRLLSVICPYYIAFNCGQRIARFCASESELMLAFIIFTKEIIKFLICFPCNDDVALMLRSRENRDSDN